MSPQHHDAVVVGAGFAGLYALHRLRDDLGLRTTVFEAGDGVGGTWYWNRYPGARCDVESLDYQYSFDEDLLREWQWSERYPAQGEILRYLQHVADRFDLMRDIALNTRVTSAVFDEGSARWTVTTDTGEEVTARFCVMATGCLSVPKGPEVAGADTFAGDILHTGRWPHEGVDFTGRRGLRGAAKGDPRVFHEHPLPHERQGRPGGLRRGARARAGGALRGRRPERGRLLHRCDDRPGGQRARRRVL